jgi:hypothetical protein
MQGLRLLEVFQFQSHARGTGCITAGEDLIYIKSGCLAYARRNNEEGVEAFFQLVDELEDDDFEWERDKTHPATPLNESLEGLLLEHARRQDENPTSPEKKTRRPHTYSLEVIKGEAVGSKYPLTKENTTLGRKSSCDIVVPDKTISARHCLFAMKKNKLSLTDLNSTNGCKVNGKKITTSQIKNGDTLTFGTVKIKVLLSF